jgi:hypothetical protein
VSKARALAIDASIVVAASFVIYAIMAARDVMFGDGPELTAAAILNTVAHPPGYPLWIMFGHAASLLPVGTLPFRVNLTAALYHALAIGAVYATAFLLTRRRLAALFAAVLLALASPIFVSWSLQAEVFSLDDLFAALVVLICVYWLEYPREWRCIVPLGAIFGLGLSNQQTLLLLAPLPAWSAWCGRAAIPRDSRTLGTVAWAALFCLAGFALPYAHTLAVSQHLTGWHFGSARTLPELADVIGRKAYGGGLVAGSAEQGSNFLARAGAMLWAMGWPAAFIAAGVVALAVRKRYRELTVALLLVALPFLLFCALANINVNDEMLRSVFQRFSLLPLVALAPFSACAFALVADRIASRRVYRFAGLGTIVAAAIVAAIFLPQLSLANAHGQRVLYRDIFNALAPNAILLTAGDAVDQSGGYFQSVEHLRPDVTIATYGLLNMPAYVRALGEAIVVPPQVVYDYPPQVRRDLLVAANPNRPFYTVGERGIHAPGPKYQPSVFGIVSQMIPNNARVNVAAHFRDEVRLQSAPGYAGVPDEHWQTNGFAAAVREYYAGGFFSTATDAQRLGNLPAARFWYESAQAYFPDPMIEQRIRTLSPVGAN